MIKINPSSFILKNILLVCVLVGSAYPALTKAADIYVKFRAESFRRTLKLVTDQPDVQPTQDFTPEPDEGTGDCYLGSLTGSSPHMTDSLYLLQNSPEFEDANFVNGNTFRFLDESSFVFLVLTPLGTSTFRREDVFIRPVSVSSHATPPADGEVENGLVQQADFVVGFPSSQNNQATGTQGIHRHRLVFKYSFTNRHLDNLVIEYTTLNDRISYQMSFDSGSGQYTHTSVRLGLDESENQADAQPERDSATSDAPEETAPDSSLQQASGDAGEIPPIVAPEETASNSSLPQALGDAGEIPPIVAPMIPPIVAPIMLESSK